MGNNKPQDLPGTSSKDTRQSYATLLDNLPGAAYRKEYYVDDARIIYVSKGFEKLTGHCPETITAQSRNQRLKDFWHPDDIDAIRKFSDKILADDRSNNDDLECKVRIRRADNSFVWVLVREKVVERRQDAVVAEGLVIDIGEEMSSKAELKEYSQRLEDKATQLRTLIGNLSGIIFRLVYLPDGNKYASLVYGEKKVPRAVLMNAEQMRELTHPEDIQLLYDEVPRRLRQTGSSEHTHRAVIGDGSVIWLHTREKLVGWEGDNMIVEGQSVDITEKMQTRLELEESERCRRRAENRLLEGRRLESLGRFASGVAHDFNNILGAIMGYARLVQEEVHAGSRVDENTTKIMAAAEQGRSVTNQILQYAGKQDIDPCWFDLEKLVVETHTLCTHCGCCNTEFIVENALSDTWLRVDRVQLGRALLNLFKNASDAVAPRRDAVRISLDEIHPGAGQSCRAQAVLVDRCVDRMAIDIETWTDKGGLCWAVSGDLRKDQSYVMISVTDKGPGMDEKLLDQIFAPFFTTKKPSRGTGLGLAVVHGITLAHGGALSVRTQPGKGTRFDLIIPRDSS